MHVTPVENNPPTTPAIAGEKNGKTGQTYVYSFQASDPEGDDIFYYIDWGDGSSSGWLGPYPSNHEFTVSHSWDSKGTYDVQAKAKDEKNLQGDWGTFRITMPLNDGCAILFALIQNLYHAIIPQIFAFFFDIFSWSLRVP
jgi:hypothetical protein